MKRDLSKKQFGRLSVIEQAGTDKFGYTVWRCKCSCGNEKIIRGSNLTSGTTKSCGCLAKENAKKHGDSTTRLYHIWYGIIRRIDDSNRKEYQYYGGRGIQICKEWRESFEAFRKWAFQNGYTDDHSIKRLDHDGDYTPSNCRCSDVKLLTTTGSGTQRGFIC